jgi:hypothetical protein
MTPLLAESIYWHFPVLIVTVSLVYSATRFEEWSLIVREAVTWGGRMTLFLVAIGVVLYLISALDWPVWATGLVVAGVAGVFYLVSHFMTGPGHHVRPS